MKIKKGQLLTVHHERKGEFKGIAVQDFDTETTTFYPIALAQEEKVDGMHRDWVQGESIACRNSLCKLELCDA